MGFTRRMALLLLFSPCLVVLGGLLGSTWPPFLVYTAALVGLFVADFLRAPKKNRFFVERTADAPFELRRMGTITLRLRHSARYTPRVTLCDTAPALFSPSDRAVTAFCPPGEAWETSYAVSPTERGQFSFGPVHFAVTGPMGFAIRRFALPCPLDAPVHPDLTAMRRYRMLAQRRQLTREETSLQKILGDGSDFVNIREYVPDDDTRRINWMTTARLSKPMTNVYEVERNRDVILAIDLGRWMGAPMGNVTRLDRALETAAALMQVALSSGDRVGLILFDAQVRQWVPPDRGETHMAALLAALYRCSASRQDSDYEALTTFLLSHRRRRGLFFLVSFFEDADAARRAVRGLTPISARYAVMAASLTDPSMKSLLMEDTKDTRLLYGKGAASYRMETQKSAATVFRRAGASCVVSEPGRILPLLVKQYLLMKRKL